MSVCGTLPGDDETRRSRLVQYLDGALRQPVSLSSLARPPDEENQTLVGGQFQTAARFVSRRGREQLEINPRRDDVRVRAGRKILLHVLGDDDARVRAPGHNPAHLFLNPAQERVAPVAVADDAQEVAAPEGDHEREAFRERHYPALPELRVNEVVLVAPQFQLQPRPGPRVVERVLGAVEGEDFHVNARGAQEIGLALDEVRRLGLFWPGPLARDHQNANRLIH